MQSCVLSQWRRKTINNKEAEKLKIKIKVKNQVKKVKKENKIQRKEI